MATKIDHYEGDPYAFGARVKRQFPDRTPLSARQWWSGFDDYFAMQKVLGKHDDTVLESGPGKPPNGIGATIAFAYMGGVTRETLVLKDDVNYVWKIATPEANPTFSFYEGTARIHAEDAEGCDVSYTIDFVLTETDRALRQALIETPLPKGPTRAAEVGRFVLHRDGVRNQFTFPVECPLEKLWAAVGNWEDVSWVQNAVGVEVLPSDNRVIRFADGSALEEVLVSLDKETHTLTYEPVKPNMPVRMYHGILQLEATGPGTTQVTYTQVFIPKDGLDPVAVRAQLGDAFRSRFAWVQKTFRS